MTWSSWTRMQLQLLDRHRWGTRLELANAIVVYLESFHQPPAPPPRPGLRSPIVFQSRQPTTVA